ncbi:F-box protein At3g07870-like [Papaver somniferum]|uniref:F-box protein At3g07870-like n=1 Tax=Papaver somniferum TaxID=3469 RepID=UPI000E6FACE5|nr:F-box protein At3g07870-like [Papaver somniferum]
MHNNITLTLNNGFGYDCLIDDYKLLEILPGRNNSRPVVGVYLLRSDSWKPGYIPYKFYRETPPGVLSNGALHWYLCMLYSSDDSSESFEVWVMKDYGVKESWMQVYNIPWMTMFGRTLRCFRQIQCLRNRELLCEIKTQHDDKADDSTMVLYDPKDDKYSILKMNGDRSYFTHSIFQIESYVQNSVSLNSGTEMQIEMQIA